MKAKPVKIRTLIRERRISPMSPVVLASEKLEINWLPLFNDEYVYGPTPGIIEAADAVLSELKPRTVIDLFGGSGALSKLALMRGARKVIYVDSYPEAAKRNLRDLPEIEIVKEDAFKFLESDTSCDVLIADPPEELIDPLLRRVRRIREIAAKAALMWIGPSNKSVHRRRRLSGFRMTKLLEAWGDCFALLWKPGLREKVENVKRLLG
ncbi:MAG: RsmD family RNA methyltransferase [Thaumarchaeota archaeon]|nr:RsmD family RNA methyltransferase [Nitrososphaerota archaeon]